MRKLFCKNMFQTLMGARLIVRNGVSYIINFKNSATEAYSERLQTSKTKHPANIN